MLKTVECGMAGTLDNADLKPPFEERSFQKQNPSRDCRVARRKQKANSRHEAVARVLGAIWWEHDMSLQTLTLASGWTTLMCYCKNLIQGKQWTKIQPPNTLSCAFALEPKPQRFVCDAQTRKLLRPLLVYYCVPRIQTFCAFYLIP